MLVGGLFFTVGLLASCSGRPRVDMGPLDLEEVSHGEVAVVNCCTSDVTPYRQVREMRWD